MRKEEIGEVRRVVVYWVDCVETRVPRVVEVVFRGGSKCGFRGPGLFQ